jgi:hypothetical protein
MNLEPAPLMARLGDVEIVQKDARLGHSVGYDECRYTRKQLPNEQLVARQANDQVPEGNGRPLSL